MKSMLECKLKNRFLKNLCGLVFGVLIVSCTTDDNQVKSLEEKIIEESWCFQHHREVCLIGDDFKYT